MPKYLVSATYNADGLAGLQKDTASGRQKMLKKAIKGLGGSWRRSTSVSAPTMPS